MSDLMGQIAQALADLPHKPCACAHEAQEHVGTEGCSRCSCDIRRFEVEQGCVHYWDHDGGERVSLAEHLRRRTGATP